MKLSERRDLDNIKSHKKQGFTLSLENTFLEKLREEGSNWAPSSPFRVDLTTFVRNVYLLYPD